MLAEDPAALAELKRATVLSAEWELAPGATTEEEAIRQLHAERPHVLVGVPGPSRAWSNARCEAYPFLRVVSDRASPGAVAVASLEQVRAAVKPSDGPGGPIRA